jgi:hypothetical protein
MNLENDHSFDEILTFGNKKSYSIELGKNLADRINKHIQLLKYLNHKIKSKQVWAEKAIQEKLEREKDLPPDEGIEDEYFHFKISDQVQKEVKQRVKLIKQFKNSYSQKKWFLEAFYEKLDQDEQVAQQLMKDMLDVASKRN